MTEKVLVTGGFGLVGSQTVRRLAVGGPPVCAPRPAVILPPAYRHPDLARRGNVDATAELLRAAQASEHPPRFVLASSNAVYGSRNPYRHPDRLRVDSPLRPADLYGAHKAVAEKQGRASRLEWG